MKFLSLFTFSFLLHGQSSAAEGIADLSPVGSFRHNKILLEKTIKDSTDSCFITTRTNTLPSGYMSVEVFEDPKAMFTSKLRRSTFEDSFVTNCVFSNMIRFQSELGKFDFKYVQLWTSCSQKYLSNFYDAKNVSCEMALRISETEFSDESKLLTVSHVKENKITENKMLMRAVEILSLWPNKIPITGDPGDYKSPQ